MSDASVFPDPTYKRTVLEPLFDSVKAHHVESFSAINRAHLVMLAETGILPAKTARDLANALVEIDTSLDLAALEYTCEHEDFFFLISA
jgi:argininosuccinate lyase